MLTIVHYIKLHYITLRYLSVEAMKRDQHEQQMQQHIDADWQNTPDNKTDISVFIL